MTAGPRIFTPEYYARLAELEERHWWSVGMRSIATKLLERYAPQECNWRVLDAGCGTGLGLAWVKRYTDGEPVGLDIAREGLEFCARRGQRRLVQGTVLRLAFQSNHFDLVLSSDVLQHLPRPDGDDQALAEVTRVLKPGGLLLLRTNSCCGFPQSLDSNYQRYRLPQLESVVRGAGLRIRTATYVNCLPGLVESMRRALTTGNEQAGYTGLAVRQVRANLVTRIFYRTLLWEGAYLAPGNRSLPFGHSILILAEKRA